eukprot:18633_1
MASNLKQKRNLMKLSKPKLVRICKANKISSTGTKTEMIERLLDCKELVLDYKEKRKRKLEKEKEKKERKDKEKKELLSMKVYRPRKFLSMKVYKNYIVFGYIRDLENSKFCPDTLIKLVMQYMRLDNIKFNAYFGEYFNDIKDDGIILSRSKHGAMRRDKVKAPRRKGVKTGYINGNPYWSDHSIFYGCSNGFKPNTGIHTFSIKINKCNNYNPSAQYYGDCIGIISDKECFEKPSDIRIFCTAYYINLSYYMAESKYLRNTSTLSHTILTGEYQDTKSYGIKNVNQTQQIEIKDIITIYFDSDKGKLYFQVDKDMKAYKLCDTFNIDPNITYYPAIYTYKEGNEYELVKVLSTHPQF